jgi:6-phospho-beta-glucosidase
MKLAIVGGAGVRVPLLVRGLTRADLPIAEIALFDTDRARLSVMAPLTQRLAGKVPISWCDSTAPCLDGASFVFTSIRVGGIDARARDEQIAMAHGIVGQETVGPGGFAMAMRTIPHMVDYAHLVERHAPDAWVINFTNPVGIITEAVRSETSARIIGICDTPTELFEDIAHALEVPSAECHFDYFGLNHLGWVREVYHRGRPQLDRLWESAERLRAIYRVPLFEPEFLRSLRLLPTEYVYYYYRSHDAFENVRRAARSRGMVIQQLNAKLFDDLAAPGADTIATYEAYLAARNAGYLQIESGAASITCPERSGGRAHSPWAELTGYDKIALAVVRAIHTNSGAIIPLNVTNNGNLPELQDSDVVEVPCAVNANGALPLHVGPVPQQVRDLLIQVKDYERRTVRAALSQNRQTAQDALARNPLVADRALAGRLLEALDA